MGNIYKSISSLLHKLVVVVVYNISYFRCSYNIANIFIKQILLIFILIF